MFRSPALNLLIVEDSPIVRERLVALAREYLAADSIDTANNGIDAIECFDRASPALVTLDISLPRLSGLEVLAHIRRRGTPAEVAVFTSSTSPEMEARCRELGANHFFDKSKDIAPMIAVLRDLAGQTSPPDSRDLTK